jgi:outer membrane protein OmpA-like peptidoglycan-associated protein
MLDRNRLAGVVLLAGMAGCATRIPEAPSLGAARQAYLTAQYGPAAKYAPVDFDRAGLALDEAERLSLEHPGSDEAEAQAYIAVRRAQLANAHGGAELASVQRDRAVVASLQAQSQRVAQVSEELQRANTTLAQAAASREQGPVARTPEGTGHPETIRHEERGDVITVSGAVLFAHGSADLQPAARETLDRVADVLRTVPDRHVVVEGYTDSTGDPGVNERLSVARAEAVQKYLADAGVGSSRVSTQGFGARQPVATNATSEGRAANRRVEIVIQPRAGAAEPMPPGDSDRPR